MAQLRQSNLHTATYRLFIAAAAETGDMQLARTLIDNAKAEDALKPTVFTGLIKALMKKGDEASAFAALKVSVPAPTLGSHGCDVVCARRR